MIRRRIVTGDEQNCHTGWRKYYAYLDHPGVIAKIKRRTNKRERREGAQECRREIAEALWKEET